MPGSEFYPGWSVCAPTSGRAQSSRAGHVPAITLVPAIGLLVACIWQCLISVSMLMAGAQTVSGARLHHTPAQGSFGRSPSRCRAHSGQGHECQFQMSCNIGARENPVDHTCWTNKTTDHAGAPPQVTLVRKVSSVQVQS
jgi:hypothetical protein